MATFADALVTLVTDLRSAGLSAGIDPADVNPPGVLVRADAILPPPPKLCGGQLVRVSLFLVVPDTLAVPVLRDLADLEARVLPALAAADVTLTADDRPFERLVMPDDPTGLPSLRLIGLVPVHAPVTVRN